MFLVSCTAFIKCIWACSCDVNMWLYIILYLYINPNKNLCTMYVYIVLNLPLKKVLLVLIYSKQLEQPKCLALSWPILSHVYIYIYNSFSWLFAFWFSHSFYQKGSLSGGPIVEPLILPKLFAQFLTISRWFAFLSLADLAVFRQWIITFMKYHEHIDIHISYDA